MRGDLDMSAPAFGVALGTFYWGYFIFEVPSNLIMEKVGARLWIARIMITWGLLAGATALVTGATSFAAVRFLVGGGGSRVVPGDHPVFPLLFSEPPPCPHCFGLSDRTADRGGWRGADLDSASGPRRLARLARLADHVTRPGGFAP